MYELSVTNVCTPWTSLPPVNSAVLCYKNEIQRFQRKIPDDSIKKSAKSVSKAFVFGAIQHASGRHKYGHYTWNHS